MANLSEVRNLAEVRLRLVVWCRLAAFIHGVVGDEAFVVGDKGSNLVELSIDKNLFC
jgi:hypothetical protein